ncbi:hypothetical protein AB0C61_38650, partial [Streptomyces sp. NPDC048680]|uniref:hypothetical protein n=1 Tax=Streptomyces sp. NPDC048680 TaxID=3155492 RepID=UPI0034378640
MTVAMLGRAGVFASVGSGRLMAMAGYLDRFSGWEPSGLLAPTLFVRAGEGLPGIEVAEPWSLPHSEVIVRGDHFSVLEEHARTTALA